MLRDLRREIAKIPRLKQDDRRSRRTKQPLFFVVDLAILANAFQRWHQHGKRFVTALLAFSQTNHRCGVARVHQQLESADALQRYDLAIRQRTGNGGEGIVGVRGLRPQPKTWAALGTRVRLRMKPATGRGTIFTAARRTQRELLHRRVGPVVRNVQNDCVAWSALGAVRERIAETPAPRREDFSEAPGTGSDVRKNRREFVASGRRLLAACKNLEPVASAGCNPEHIFGCDHRSRGTCRSEFEQEFIQLLRFPLNFDLQAGMGVSHPSGNPRFFGKAVHRRAKSNALHGPMKRDAKAFGLG